MSARPCRRCAVCQRHQATPVLLCRGDYKQAPTPSRGGAGPENRAGDSTEPALLPLRREDINQAERPVVAET